MDTQVRLAFLLLLLRLLLLLLLSVGRGRACPAPTWTPLRAALRAELCEAVRSELGTLSYADADRQST